MSENEKKKEINLKNISTEQRNINTIDIDLVPTKKRF